MTNTPIKIDLADLTEEKLEEAIKAGRIHCQYTAPCIIGTLMNAEQRKIAERGDFGASTEIVALIGEGIIEIPRGQAIYAERLQQRFDNSFSVSNAQLRRYARSVMKRFARKEPLGQGGTA